MSPSDGYAGLKCVVSDAGMKSSSLSLPMNAAATVASVFLLLLSFRKITAHDVFSFFVKTMSIFMVCILFFVLYM